MRKLIPALIAALLIVCLATIAQARQGGLALGIGLDAMIPSDPDMHGGALPDAGWSNVMSGGTYDYAAERPQYYSPNRPELILGPSLQLSWLSRVGVGFEISERFGWLYFQPNSELDVGFSQLILPTLLTIKYQPALGRRKSWRPFVGAGIGAYYVASVLSGPDLFDRTPNPDYLGGDTDADPWLYKQRRFDNSGWSIGYHGALGLDYSVNRRLRLRAAALYETCRTKVAGAELIDDGAGSWHWQKEEIEGDLGGITVQLGLGTKF